MFLNINENHMIRDFEDNCKEMYNQSSRSPAIKDTNPKVQDYYNQGSVPQTKILLPTKKVKYMSLKLLNSDSVQT